MPTLAATIPATLGDTICIKSHLDAVRDHYQEIRLGYPQPTNSFLDQLGALFFSQPPYVYQPHSTAPFRAQYHILSDNGLRPQKPHQPALLCQGTTLDVGPYVALSTKVRYLTPSRWAEMQGPMFQAINSLADRYTIVVLGERQVEMRPEYLNQPDIFGVYQDIVRNVSPLVDLTIPALGITSPTLSQVQQDCLIMNRARAVITLGIGGNLCMALGSGANVIGYRMDAEPIASALFDGPTYPGVAISRDPGEFLGRLVIP